MFPRWMRWLFLGVIAYLIYVGSQAPQRLVAPVKTGIPPITQENYPGIAKALDASHWKQTLNPNLRPEICGGTLSYPADSLPMKWVEDEAGSGEEIACGDTALVRITVWNAAGRKQAEETLPITLGAGSFGIGMDQLLVGSRLGSVRTAWLPPVALARGKGPTPSPALRAALPAGKTALVTVERVAD